jgi:hypothetical protein
LCFDDSHSNRSEVDSYCGLDFHFLYSQGYEFVVVVVVVSLI